MSGQAIEYCPRKEYLSNRGFTPTQMAEILMNHLSHQLANPEFADYVTTCLQFLETLPKEARVDFDLNTHPPKPYVTNFSLLTHIYSSGPHIM